MSRLSVVYLAVALIVIVALSLAACGGASPSPQNLPDAEDVLIEAAEPPAEGEPGTTGGMSITMMAAQPPADTSQTITLQPGWNAVFLEVEPETNQTDEAFRGMPVESVWTWSPQSSTNVQSVPDPSTLQPGQPDWLAYLPSDSQNSSLFTLQGGHSYLIHLGGNVAVDWTLMGPPATQSIDWQANSFNLVGFHVDPSAPPTFASFLAPSPAHAGQDVYAWDDTSGQWKEINDLATERIQPGAAYWVYSQGPSTYSGPLSVTFEQGEGLHFGRILTEQTLRIRNETPVSRQIAIQQPAGEEFLAYWSWASDPPGWAGFPAGFSILAEEELAVRIAIRRHKIPGSILEDLHESVLGISDDQGTQLLLPVSAESTAGPQVGLWVGTATVDKVSYAADTGDQVTPKKTASEFQMRLIVHVDSAGQAKLLQQVTLMWKEGIEERADPQNPESPKIVVEPGEFVLVTKDELISEYEGAAIRDGKPVGRRVSSAAFAFEEPVNLTGVFGSGLLASEPITLGYDDPLNPI